MNYTSLVTEHRLRYNVFPTFLTHLKLAPHDLTLTLVCLVSSVCLLGLCASSLLVTSVQRVTGRPCTHPPRTHHRAMQGIQYHSNGKKMYEGPFVNGERHGQVRPYYPMHGCHWPAPISTMAWKMDLRCAFIRHPHRMLYITGNHHVSARFHTPCIVY